MCVYRQVFTYACINMINIYFQVKKVMNGVYQSARSELETDGSYKGSEVLSVLLHIIKVITMISSLTLFLSNIHIAFS